MRKYFDSVPHEKLKELLFRIIKDRKCLALLFEIIDSYSISDGRGLPIGNLTSQFFANCYLSPLDHFVLEKLKPKGYARYMDDIAVFSDFKPLSRHSEFFKHVKGQLSIRFNKVLESELANPIFNSK